MATIHGQTGGGDIFNFGFLLQHDNALQAAADAVATGWKNTVLTPDVHAWTPHVTFGGVRLSEIDVPTGTVLNVAEAAIAWAGSNGAANLPSEVAVCVTLRPVAGTQKGRFYLPAPPAAALTPDGHVAVDWQTAMANRLQTFFQTTLGGAGSPMRVSIYSRKNRTTTGVQSISLGNVFDAQRRRRNKLPETRISRSVL